MLVPSIIKNELRRIRSALWFRPTMLCLAAGALAVAIMPIGTWAGHHVPMKLPSVEVGDVKQLLRLMVGAMLTVSTATMSVLVLTLSLAAGQASPRSVPELMADRVTPNTLDTLLATFVFALTALFMLELGSVDATGLTLIFSLSLLFVAMAVKYLVQWVHHVADSMKLNRIVQRIHRQAQLALQGHYDSDRRRCFAGSNREILPRTLSLTGFMVI